MSALTSTLASEGDRVSSGTSIRLFGRGFRREDDPTADVTMLTFFSARWMSALCRSRPVFRPTQTRS